MKDRHPTFPKSFLWLYVLLSYGLVVGLTLDGWAHNHIGGDIDPFFTPYHGVIYGSFLLLSTLVFWRMYTNRVQGFQWKRLVPRGYGQALVGMIGLSLAGFWDMLWHLAFGVEIQTMDTLMSPSHLLLVFSGFLIVSAPWRSLWHMKTLPRGLCSFLPYILSFSFGMMPIIFILQWAHPWVHPWMRVSDQIIYPFFIAAGYVDPTFLGSVVSVASILIMGSVILAGFLSSMRRFLFPVGSYLFFLVLMASYLVFMWDDYSLLLFSVVIGIVIEFVFLVAQAVLPSKQWFIRFFSVAFPLMLWGGFLFWLYIDGGISWSVHMTSGVLFMLAVGGGTLGYAMVHEHDVKDIASVQGVRGGETILFLLGSIVFAISLYFVSTQTGFADVLREQFHQVEHVSASLDAFAPIEEVLGREDVLIHTFGDYHEE